MRGCKHGLRAVNNSAISSDAKKSRFSFSIKSIKSCVKLREEIIGERLDDTDEIKQILEKKLRT